jgi:hypothetical protein
MIDISVVAFLTAGFALAHALGSIEDSEPDELLCPLMIVMEDGERSLQRFEADTQEEAIKEGKAVGRQLTNKVDAWAFAREAIVRPTGSAKVPTDVIIVDFWASGMSESISVIQRFKRKSSTQHFSLIGEPYFVVGPSIGGQILDDSEAKPHIKQLMVGVRNHPVVKDLWKKWMK